MKMLKIYIAAPWKHYGKAKKLRDILESKGYTVTSRWMEHTRDIYKPTNIAEREALEDYADVLYADVVIVINSRVSEGKAVEQGIALARNIPIIVIGKNYSNVFQHIRKFFTHVKNVPEALSMLERWKEVGPRCQMRS